MGAPFAENPNTVTLMKSAESFGIRIVGATASPLVEGGIRATRPLVSFYDGGTKAIIDYSDTVDPYDAAYLSFLAANAIPGTELVLGNATFLSPNFTYSTNLGGTYEVTGITNEGKVILADVGFTFSGYPDTDLYIPERFVGIPTLSAPALTPPTVSYIENLVPIPGTWTLRSLGAYGASGGLRQLVEIPGSTSNPGRFDVAGYAETADGREYIFTEQGLTAENFLGSDTTVNLYERGSIPGHVAAVDTRINGTVKVFDSDGLFVACFEEQNAMQAYVKQYVFPDDQILYQAGAECGTFVRDKAQEVPELFSAWDCSFALVLLPEVIGGSIWQINNSYRNTIVVGSVYSAVKLDVSHDSLADSYLYISSTSDPATEYTRSVVRMGVPGTPGAAIFIGLGSDTPNPLQVISSDSAATQIIVLSFTSA